MPTQHLLNLPHACGHPLLIGIRQAVHFSPVKTADNAISDALVTCGYESYVRAILFVGRLDVFKIVPPLRLCAFVLRYSSEEDPAGGLLKWSVIRL